jgi:hypothetical protein
VILVMRRRKRLKRNDANSWFLWAVQFDSRTVWFCLIRFHWIDLVSFPSGFLVAICVVAGLFL